MPRQAASMPFRPSSGIFDGHAAPCDPPGDRAGDDRRGCRRPRGVPRAPGGHRHGNRDDPLRLGTPPQSRALPAPEWTYGAPKSHPAAVGDPHASIQPVSGLTPLTASGSVTASGPHRPYSPQPDRLAAKPMEGPAFGLQVSTGFSQEADR
jgi:hypothetical protein